MRIKCDKDTCPNLIEKTNILHRKSLTKFCPFVNTSKSKDGRFSKKKNKVQGWKYYLKYELCNLINAVKK